MAKKEVKTDLWVYTLLKEANVELEPQGSSILEINDAFKTASKNGTKKVGFPDYVGVVKKYLLVIEDKHGLEKHIKLNDKGLISTEQKDIKNYAINGALFYGQHLAKNTTYKKIMIPVTKEDDIIPDWEFMEEYVKEQETHKKHTYKVYTDSILKEIEYKDIIDLKDMKWKEFSISSICNINSGRDIYANERENGLTPYISSGTSNNGIGYFVSNSNNTLEAGAISVNRNGSVGYAYYHKYHALYSNDCRKIKLKQNNNEYTSLFITNQIVQQRDKYNYGYKMGTKRLSKQNIMLPINDKSEPDYEYMKQFIKNLMNKKYNMYSKLR